jgi:thiamine biosynthesis lipoprotein
MMWRTWHIGKKRERARLVVSECKVVVVVAVKLTSHLIIGFAALISVAPVRLHGSAADDQTHVYRYLMGTSISIEAYGGDPATRRAAIDRAFGAIAEIDRLMSNYRDDSELALVNRRAAVSAVPISDPMFAVLDAAQRVSRDSSGAFDVTVGPLVKLWGFHDKRPHVPTATELASVRPLVGYNNVVLTAAGHTVRFAQSGVELDLGGIAKGFAVELAANVLRESRLGGLIDAGGNQYLLGHPPSKTRWTVGVKNPEQADRILGTIETEETSVSTSANSSNFLEADGRRYGHILDPHTLRPSTSALSVTILSRDGTLADALSKAVFVLGPSAGLRLLARYPGTSAVVAYQGSDGAIAVASLMTSGTVFHSNVPQVEHVH